MKGSLLELLLPAAADGGGQEEGGAAKSAVLPFHVKKTQNGGYMLTEVV